MQKILLFGLVKTLKRAGGSRQVALYASAAARKLADIVELAIYIRLCWRESGGVQARHVKFLTILYISAAMTKLKDIINS